MKRTKKAIFTAAFFLALESSVAVHCSYGGSEDGFPVTVVDGLGRRVTVEKAPDKIISTIPSNTEILYDLGLKDKVIAVTSHCGKTSDVSGKCVIGGWSEPAIAEKISSLKPDLVLAFGGLQSPLAPEMSKRGIPAFVFFPRSVDETLEQILLVGRITGKVNEAGDIVRRCRTRLAEIEERLKNMPLEKRLKCLRLMSTEAMVIGGGSFQSDIIKKAGGVNIFAEIKDDYPVVTLEDIRERNPDMIIFNRDNEKKAIDWFLAQEGWKDLRAARDGRLISISCDYICHPNTRIDTTVGMLARRFYPGRFISNGDYPRRIISLSPSVTEELYLLGAQDRLIGCTTYCRRPKDAQTKEKVGTVIEVNMEKIVMLEPDMVLATSLTDVRAVEKLGRLGIKVISIPPPGSFDELCKQFLELGEILGEEEKARKIVNDARNKVGLIRKKAGNLSSPRVFVQIGSSPLFAATDDYFIDDFVGFAGGTNIAEKSKTGLYSREEVIKRNPDVIVVVTMGMVGDKEIENWKNYKTLNAVKNNRIHLVDPYRLCSSTPESFVDMLEEFVEILHPDETGRKL